VFIAIFFLLLSFLLGVFWTEFWLNLSILIIIQIPLTLSLSAGQQLVLILASFKLCFKPSFHPIRKIQSQLVVFLNLRFVLYSLASPDNLVLAADSTCDSSHSLFFCTSFNIINECFQGFLLPIVFLNISIVRSWMRCICISVYDMRNIQNDDCILIFSHMKCWEIQWGRRNLGSIHWWYERMCKKQWMGWITVLSAARTRLSGLAKEYKNRNRQIEETPPAGLNFCELMKRRFETQLNEASIMNQLLTCTQRKGERVSEYIMRMEKI